MMTIDSPRFGPIEIAADKILEFPGGLPGFEDLRRYTLLSPETPPGAEGPRYLILQSVDDPDVAFHVADPANYGFRYEIVLADESVEAIKLTDPAEAIVVVMLLSEGGGVRANLNAPLVINPTARLGVQHVFSRLDYEVMLKAK